VRPAAIAEKLGRNIFSDQSRAHQRVEGLGCLARIWTRHWLRARLQLEIIYRDVYRINGDRARLAKWAQMVRSRIGN
jgi:hypothetical protein